MVLAKSTSYPSDEIETLAKELQQSRQIIQAIYDSTQSLIIFLSLDFKVIFFNKQAMYASKMLYGKDLSIGDTFLEYVREKDEEVLKSFLGNFAEAITTNKVVTSEREVRFHNTSSLFRCEYTPVFYEAKAVGVAMQIVDISERKLREEKPTRQTEELGRIAGIQSHVTRQPIATIMGLLNIFDTKSLSADNANIVQMLETEICKLDSLIRETVVRANSL